MISIFFPVKKIAWTMYISLLTAVVLLLPAAVEPQADEPRSTIAKVERARKQVTLSGYTRSRAKMTVASEVAGKVLRVNYDVGHTIDKQPFIVIDTTFINFQIEQVETSLKKLTIAQSRSISRVSFLQKEYQRIARLRQSDVTSESRYDAAVEELAQARLESQSTEAEIAALKTQLKELREKRNRHSIYVPRDWIVVEKKIEPGEIIATGQPLAQVADYTQLVVPLFVSAKELEALESRAQLNIMVEGEPAQATVNWVNPEFDERSRKLAVELILPSYSGPHRGGLLTEMSLEIQADELMVPKTAISDRYENPRVTLKSNGQSIPIVILDEDGSYVLIARNHELAPGMELVAHLPKP
jgi:RND family efflux transporter MFP subunit